MMIEIGEPLRSHKQGQGIVVTFGVRVQHRRSFWQWLLRRAPRVRYKLWPFYTDYGIVWREFPSMHRCSYGRSTELEELYRRWKILEQVVA
jgi:hypothetical protein